MNAACGPYMNACTARPLTMANMMAELGLRIEQRKQERTARRCRAGGAGAVDGAAAETIRQQSGHEDESHVERGADGERA